MSASVATASHEDRHIPAKYAGVLAPNYYCRGWNAKRAKYCGARAGLGTAHPRVGRCKNHGGNHPVKHGLSRRYELQHAPKIADLIEQYANDPEPFNILQELAVARALMHDWLDRYSTFVTALIGWYDTWEGKYIPINEAEKTALTRSLDEYEAMLTEMGDDATEQQLGALELARSAVTFLSMQQEPKPRQILDVSDAMKHVDTISKIITRAETLRAQGTVSIERIRLFLLALDRVVEVEVPDLGQRERLRRAINSIRV